MLPNSLTSQKGFNIKQNFVEKDNNGSALFSGLLKYSLMPAKEKFNQEQDRKFINDIYDTYDDPPYGSHYLKTDYNTKKYDFNTGVGNIVFNDRTYFGPDDVLPMDILFKMVQASKKVGIDPMDLITTAAMETRFNPDDIHSYEFDDGLYTTDIGWTRFIDKDFLAPSFQNYLLQTGVVPSKQVKKDASGYWIDDPAGFFDSLPLETLKKYKNDYDNLIKTKYKIPEENNIPFYAPALYIKKKGIQGYNPKEVKGGSSVEMPGKFKQGRMDRYRQIKNILMKETLLQQVLNRMEGK